jgi:hypothetical protein
LAGSWSHWQPLRIRKRIPLSVLRQLATRRPVGFLGQNSRRMGSIRSQSESGTSQMVGRGLVFFFRWILVAAIVGTLRSMHTLHCNSRKGKAKSGLLG